MNYIFNDKEYVNIVRNIIDNNEFIQIKDCDHHGTTRFAHSLRVSYISYKISKVLKLDERKTARGGLLHDFFWTNNKDMKSKTLSVFKHNIEAVNNAESIFIISEKEKDIIETHMFPIVPNKLPKYAESWLVSFVDKGVSVFEFLNNYSSSLKIKLRNTAVITILFFTRMI